MILTHGIWSLLIVTWLPLMVHGLYSKYMAPAQVKGHHTHGTCPPHITSHNMSSAITCHHASHITTITCNHLSHVTSHHMLLPIPCRHPSHVATGRMLPPSTCYYQSHVTTQHMLLLITCYHPSQFFHPSSHVTIYNCMSKSITCHYQSYIIYLFNTSNHYMLPPITFMMSESVTRNEWVIKCDELGGNM
jgi:hypothetical protein